jgi:hypothetical protein
VDRTLTITSKYFPERPDDVHVRRGGWGPIRLATLPQYQPRRVRDGANESIEVNLVVGVKDTETIRARPASIRHCLRMRTAASANW